MAGISDTTENTVPVSGDCLANGSTSVLGLQTEFDTITEEILKNHVSLWLWEIDSAAEWYKLIQFVVEVAT